MVNFTLLKYFFVLLGSKLTDLHIEKFNSVFAAFKSEFTYFNQDLHILITLLILAEKSIFRVHIPKMSHVIFKFAFEIFDPKF